MSPSEDQLRAALRDGAADGSGGLNPDTFIAQANEIRHRRRVRYGSALGAAAVVAVGGVLIGTLGGTTHTNNAASQQQRLPVAASDQVAAGAASSSAAAGAGSTNGSAFGCPATAPSRATIGTGHGSFFRTSVVSFTLCAYPESGGAALSSEAGAVLTSTVSGADAEQLAASLDGAATAPSPNPCPLFRTADGKLLAMIPVSADGTAMTPVTAVVLQNWCNQPVTNGAVVRYNWNPPAALAPYLRQLASAGGGTVPSPRPVSSSPLEHGSPINS